MTERSINRTRGEGGSGDADDCDGEGGRDGAKRCEVLAGVP
jgi:hypothetical protein